MNNEVLVKTLGEETEAVSQSQINHASEWIFNYIHENRDKLRTLGIPRQEIHDEYKKSTHWPIGRRAFAPMLHLAGLEQTLKSGRFVYFLNV